MKINLIYALLLAPTINAATIVTMTPGTPTGTTTAGNIITASTTDSAGFATDNFGAADVAAYTTDFGTSLSGNLRSSTAGGNDTITITNTNLVAEQTFLVLYDLDIPGDSITFTMGAPTLVLITDTIAATPPATVNWNPTTLTATGNTTIGNPNANAIIFDITGINTVAWSDAAISRQVNFSVYTAPPVTAPLVPEPSSTALLGLATLTLLAKRRRK